MILFVIFIGGFMPTGVFSKVVRGFEVWLLGDAYWAVIIIAFLWIGMNLWRKFKDKKPESLSPMILTNTSILMFMSYIDAEEEGFKFVKEIVLRSAAYFEPEIPVNNGGGLLGGTIYGLCSFPFGKNIVILIIVLMMIVAAIMLSRMETFHPGISSIGNSVSEFLRKPETAVMEEEEPAERKPIPNLWTMSSSIKKKISEYSSVVHTHVPEIEEEPAPVQRGWADDIYTQPEPEPAAEERSSDIPEGMRKMINIKADGPTEEILLVSIPGKTVSSKKSLFINVDDLLDEDDEDHSRLMQEYVPEPEPEERRNLWLDADRDEEQVKHDIPPVQQVLPLEVEAAVKPVSAAPAVEAATQSNQRKRTAAHARRTTEKEKPYRLPSPALLDPVPPRNRNSANEIEAREKGELLIQILRNFEVESRLIDTHIGPAVTQFEIRPDANVKISKINSLTDNIKMQLAAKDIRIEAPIPGRNAIGVEVPNAETSVVKMRDLLNEASEKDKKSPLMFFLGKDLMGRTVTCRLDKMPHLLIAGATGSGKSVCMNSIITSLLLRTDPDKVKMLLIDPKKVEFTPYHAIPHLIGPVINEPSQANNALKVIVQKMDERYNMFALAGVRNIEGYNSKVIAQNGQPNEDGSPAPKYMPYIVVIIDELADLMLVAGKEVEGSIQRITQLARAAGIHLIVATQRPSVNVITGVIKANIPSRIAFSVSSAIDSRTILDSHGAERLLGNGDMLYLPMGSNSAQRVQGVYVTDEEVQKIVAFVSEQKKPHYDDSFILLEGINDGEGGIATVTDDPMFEEVKEYVVEAQKASTSLLQRRFGIGYNRAARIIDALEEKGIIGPAQGSKPREVYLKPEKKQNMTETGGTY